MNRVFIKNIVINEKNRISGFVKNIRDKKSICFLVIEDISGSIQVTIDKLSYENIEEILKQLTIDSVVTVEGEVVKNEFVKLNNVELLATNITILSIAETSPIIAPKGEETNIDLRLDYRWIDLRTEKNQLMFKVQSYFVNICREFLLNEDFIEIHTPKLISTESESGAGVFEVDYFGKKAFLAQSPQFYKQMAMAAGFERIFETGPVFRAEKSNSRKHATEFSGFDVEMSYIDSYKDIMKIEQDMIVYALTKVYDKFYEQIKQLFNIDLKVPQKPFPIVDLNLLYEEIEKMYGYKVNEEDKGDLTTEAEKLCEKYSLEKFNNEFIFITGFAKEKRAFYHMRDETGIPCGYDLIWKGVEITTGAQREHRYHILKQQAEEKGLSKDVADYLNFFKYGCPPHGGFGIGIDRMTLIMFNSTIKEAMFLFRGPDRLKP